MENGTNSKKESFSVLKFVAKQAVELKYMSGAIRINTHNYANTQHTTSIKQPHNEQNACTLRHITTEATKRHQ